MTPPVGRAGAMYRSRYNPPVRRPLRILVNAATAASLVLFAATLVLWVRSYGVSDEVRWRNAGGWRSVRTARGDVAVGLFVADGSDRPREFHGPRYRREEPMPAYNWLHEMNGNLDDTLAHWARAGFEWHERRNRRRGTLHAHAVVPFWAVAAVTAAAPVSWAAARWRRARRNRRARSAGLCRTCGYDLRATPGRCPECGAVAGSPAAPSAPANAAAASASDVHATTL
jgi:hypothetical protein